MKIKIPENSYFERIRMVRMVRMVRFLADRTFQLWRGPALPVRRHAARVLSELREAFLENADAREGLGQQAAEVLLGRSEEDAGASVPARGQLLKLWRERRNVWLRVDSPAHPGDQPRISFC